MRGCWSLSEAKIVIYDNECVIGFDTGGGVMMGLSPDLRFIREAALKA